MVSFKGFPCANCAISSHLTWIPPTDGYTRERDISGPDDLELWKNKLTQSY